VSLVDPDGLFATLGEWGVKKAFETIGKKIHDPDPATKRAVDSGNNKGQTTIIRNEYPGGPVKVGAGGTAIAGR
jgi:hypothetical protein